MTNNERDKLLISMSTAINDVRSDLKQTEERLTNKIDGVEKKLNDKIDGVEKKLNDKIDGVEKKLNDKIDGVEKKLNNKIDEVENKLRYEMNQMEQRLEDTMDEHVANFNEKFAKTWMQQDIDREKVNRRLNEHEDEIKRINAKLAVKRI